MYQTLITEQHERTLLITINRSDKLNALNAQVMEELSSVIDELVANDELRGAIITGSGKKAFAAGADIAGFEELDENTGRDLSKYGQSVFFKIEKCPKPIIAAVNGYALGGGCELAMACHLRIASENAVFGQPEVKLGLLAGYGGTQRLVQLIGKGKATEMLITADNLDAHAALDYGLVNYVTSLIELQEKCEEVLRKVYEQSPMGVAYTLDAISAGVNGEDGYGREAANFGKALVSEDGREGVAAFLQKRKADFKGK